MNRVAQLKISTKRAAHINVGIGRAHRLRAICVSNYCRAQASQFSTVANWCVCVLCCVAAEGTEKSISNTRRSRPRMCTYFAGHNPRHAMPFERNSILFDSVFFLSLPRPIPNRIHDAAAHNTRYAQTTVAPSCCPNMCVFFSMFIGKREKFETGNNPVVGNK